MHLALGLASLSSCQLPAPQVQAASAAGIASPGLGPFPYPCLALSLLIAPDSQSGQTRGISPISQKLPAFLEEEAQAQREGVQAGRD